VSSFVEERASMLVMAASWDDFRVDPPPWLVAIVASDMMMNVAVVVVLVVEGGEF